MAGPGVRVRICLTHPGVEGSEFGSALTGNFTVDIIAQDSEGEAASIPRFILITHP